jgi:CO/xanthine dehydrogenase FAD-binding subunit
MGFSMDLNTITAIARPTRAEEVTTWRPGLAWLAGGTWLFSEPQPNLDTLIDLHGLNWATLSVVDNDLEIGATCPIIELDRFVPPETWRAGPLLSQCCQSLLASFKIMNTATVGGNICMSLPAGSLIALTVALQARYLLLPRDGTPRCVAAADFVTGNHGNILLPGELLTKISIPLSSLMKRYAFRRASLTQLGRSAALLIGTQTPGTKDLLLTITAATPRPIQLHFPDLPDAGDLRRRIDAAVAECGWFDDVNGTPAYKQHLTYRFAEQIRREIGDDGARA